MPATDGGLDLSATLVDAVDHLLNRGAVLVGETTLSLAGVDLVYVGLNLLVSSVETLRLAGTPRVAGTRSIPAAAEPLTSTPPAIATSDPDRLAQQQPGWAAGHNGAEGTHGAPAMVTAAPDGEQSDRGLARLVLTLVEMLRQLVERQAIRRMEGEALSEDQVERMGLALRDLGRTMQTLCEAFGLEQADLNLDLGPLDGLLDGVG